MAEPGYSENTQELEVRSLKDGDEEVVAKLDQQWFGEEGMTSDRVRTFIEQSKQPNSKIGTLGVFRNGELIGFATWQIIENGALPDEYKGTMDYKERAMFLSNFTTATNYNQQDWSADEALLKAVEQKAKELGTKEILEALAKDHPYKKENNPDFDAYGFYESHGFVKEEVDSFAWGPEGLGIVVPCILYSKII